MRGSHTWTKSGLYKLCAASYGSLRAGNGSRKQKRLNIAVYETPTTTNFPTCSEEHRYLKAVIASIIVLNKGDSDSRKGQ